MCEIIGISELIPKLMNSNSGGAQYLIKNSTPEFFEKVFTDSNTLYKYFNEVEPTYVKKFVGDYSLQKWTAGMWAFLWNMWFYGYETIISDKLGFSWVTSDIKDVDRYSILHNAGVTPDLKDLFFKANYIDKLPYKDTLSINPLKASYYYYQQVQVAAKHTCLV
jgi:hypothetical protein